MRRLWVSPSTSGDHVLAITQEVTADLHFWIDARPRLVTYSKRITYGIVADAGEDRGDPWGAWRLEGWVSRTDRGTPRVDPAGE